MNKKGIFMFYTLVLTILTISITIGYFYHVDSKKMYFNIGDVQTDVISSFVKSNNVKYYLENNLESISNSSINLVLNNAGINNPILKEDYVLWRKGKKDCIPNNWEKLKETLTNEINNKINESSSLDIIRESNSLSIKLNVPILINFNGEDYNGNYTDSFEKTIVINDFNFDDFIRKSSKVKEIANFCKSDRICWENEISKIEYLKLESKDKLFKVEFTTKGIAEEIRVKAVIDFEEEINLGEKELKC